MHERVAATRTGLLAALAYTLPLLAWLLGQAMLSSADRFDPAPALQGMMTTALLLQAVALAVGLPWLLRFPALADRCCGAAMLLLVPGPLYAIAALSGAVSAGAVLIALASLAVLGLLLHGVYAICLGLSATGQVRALLFVAVQVALVVICWHYRQLWEQVLLL
jgi:hypothetical protein